VTSASTREPSSGTSSGSRTRCRAVAQSAARSTLSSTRRAPPRPRQAAVRCRIRHYSSDSPRAYEVGMNTALLIDAIVRQTTVLIAALATATGQRATLSHVADQVFADLVRELNDQGVGHKVIADMFGMALRTYHRRVSRLAASGTEQGRSLWEAVLTFVEDKSPIARADVLQRSAAIRTLRSGACCATSSNPESCTRSSTACSTARRCRSGTRRSPSGRIGARYKSLARSSMPADPSTLRPHRCDPAKHRSGQARALRHLVLRRRTDACRRWLQPGRALHEVRSTFMQARCYRRRRVTPRGFA